MNVFLVITGYFGDDEQVESVWTDEADAQREAARIEAHFDGYVVVRPRPFNRRSVDTMQT